MNTQINYKDKMAEARAIYLAMHRGAITYEKAIELTKPLLKIINVKVMEIGKKYGVKPSLIKFQDLGRVIL